MKILKKLLIAIGAFLLIVFSLFSCGVFWKSPPYYKVNKNSKLEVPIMDMISYKQIINTHRRPYSYKIKSNSGGEVYVLGVEHTTNQKNPQLDKIRSSWERINPTVALVEGRQGFLFSWIQNPIEKYGESGLVSKLSKRDGVDLYTWEPTRDGQIEILMQDFSVNQIAMFYSFRPYFSNMRYGKPENPKKKLQEYLESRTDYKHINGIYTSWKELDSIWQKDFPEINWRDYSDEYGWPDGYLSEIANASNLSRDYHMIQIITELVNKGETVFVTMGASHAPRIEKSLKAMIK